MATAGKEFKILKKSSRDYPEWLKEISSLPKQLYIRGDLPARCDYNLAIVGTRAASEYGKNIAFNIARELAELGITIVSGMALGLDTAAHLGALAGKGKTVAVLGSGADDASIYPRSNLNLAHKIIEAGGAVVSEYEPGFKATGWSFPQRNRIISGLSRGTLVVEAPHKSGALITARFALEQNREVFAVPGPVFSKNSSGTNYLIKNGAKLVASVDDILEELNWTDLKTRRAETVKEGLDGNEKKILEIIEKEPADVDKICKIIKMPAHSVLSTISLLEIKGIIKNIGGKFTKIK